MGFWTFGDETMRHLVGQAFSNSHRTAMATVPTTPAMTDRLTVLEDYAAVKNVLHVGCCDHVELIREKVAKNAWTHGQISRVEKNASASTSVPWNAGQRLRDRASCGQNDGIYEAALAHASGPHEMPPSEARRAR
jgi:hypothetical protein